jgi:hypothetical protein
MKISRFLLAAALATLGMTAHAALTLSFEPAHPTPADTIVVTLHDSSPSCLSLVTQSTHLTNEIHLYYSNVEDCGSRASFERKATLGRLPAGNYTVTLGRDFGGVPPPPEYVTQLEVRLGSTEDAPPENYAGHYVTNEAGEGVFIEQFGGKSFLTFATYASDGRATWFVMPDARFGYKAPPGRSEFTGQVYRAERTLQGAPAISVTPAGTGSWYATGFDTLALTATIDGTPLTRTLRRLRF